MAATLFERFGETIENVAMFPGRKGSFEVTLDGEIIFSKLEADRFPEFEELQEALLRRGIGSEDITLE